MSIKVGAAVFVMGLMLQLLQPTPVVAQVVTAASDTSLAHQAPAYEESQRSGFFLSNWGRPEKAAFFSAVIPGLGQAYNKAYWKIPVVLTTGATLAYFLVDNNKKYQTFQNAYLQRGLSEEDAFVDHLEYGLYNPAKGIHHRNGTRNLLTSSDTWHRNRDITIFLTVGAYVLNIMEAYVHAHMQNFDVGQNLAMQLHPNLLNISATSATTMAPGLTLTLYNKAK